MSLQAMIWAIEKSPVEDPTELAVLIALANNADENGQAAFPSVATISYNARISTRTVHRHIANLLDRGLLTKGDQRFVQFLPPNRRPVVYDLVMNKVREDRKKKPQVSWGDNLTPREEVEVTPMTGQTPSGVTPETAWGDTHDALGVTQVADKQSLELSLEHKTLKPSVRTNGSVGARETSNEQKNFTQQPDHEHSTLENVTEVQEPKSAPTREQEPVKAAVSSSVDAGSGSEDRELKPWQMRDYWGNIVKNPEYVATEEDIRWMTNYYIERGFDADYAARFSRSQLMTPAQREAQQFLDSIDVELSVDEKREFYPLVTKLFGGSWQAGDLAQKLCWGLDGFGSPVAGFRKRLKGLVGGQVRTA